MTNFFAAMRKSVNSKSKEKYEQTESEMKVNISKKLFIIDPNLTNFFLVPILTKLN